MIHNYQKNIAKSLHFSIFAHYFNDELIYFKYNTGNFKYDFSYFKYKSSYFKYRSVQLFYI